MFAVHCPQHGSKVLLDVRRVTGLTNLGDGVIAVELTCYDGEHLFLMAGSRSVPRPAGTTFDRLWALVIPPQHALVTDEDDQPGAVVSPGPAARPGKRVGLARSLREEIPDLGTPMSVWIALQARLGRRPAALVGPRSHLDEVSFRLAAQHGLVAVVEPI